MKGVIFDVDGVILDSMPIWMHAGEKYLLGKGKQPEEKLGEKLFSMSMAEGAQYMKERWNLLEPIDVICEEINQVVIDAYENSIPLKVGVLETLQSLKQKKIPVVVATSSDKHVVRAAFCRLGIDSYFEKIFTCTEIGAGKSRPDIFLAAAKYMELISGESSQKNSDIYVVEDSLSAARTAKQAGFTVVGIFDEASENEWEKLCVVADIHSMELSPELFL